jgi:RNA polymerase sigma-70 factor (ECF subfamily)
MPALSERPGDSLERQETMSQIVRLMETLPKNQREVLRLKFQSDLSYKQISEITGLSVTNVGFLIHTAIKTLRKQLLAETDQRRMQ